NSRKALLRSYRALPFPDIEPYRLLKVATEVFLTLHCGVNFDLSRPKVGRDGDQAHHLVSEEINQGELVGIKIGQGPSDSLKGVGDESDRVQEQERYSRALNIGDIESAWGEYLRTVSTDEKNPTKSLFTLPYLEFVKRKLKDVPVVEPKD